MHSQTGSKSLSRFPPALHPIISTVFPDTLQLLLEVAGASATWLAHRYVSTTLERGDANVILVTWLHGARFWKQELRKATSINCDELSIAGRMVIVEADENSANPKQRKSAAENWHTQISSALASLKSQKDILLVLDSPDILLGIERMSANTLLSITMELRSLANNTIIITSSDIFPSGHSILPSALQTEQQQFLTSLIHQADFILSSRTLDTGQASDVSGVLRVTRGGHVPNSGVAQAIDKEYLYHVDAGRAAHVWHRGADR